MKKLIPIFLVCAPACAGLDSALGAGGTPEETEAHITAIEQAARGPADLIFPGVGGAAVLALGWAARQYVRKRKAAKAT